MPWTVCAELAQRALIVAGCVAAPVLAVILGASILTNLLQAATAQSDPTTGTVPRLVAGAVAVAIFGAWMLALLAEFWSGLWTHLPSFTR